MSVDRRITRAFASPRTSWRRGIAVLLGAAVGLALPVTAAASDAAPRSCDPVYGCAPVRTDQQGARCSLSAASAAPGAAVIAQIEDAAAADQVTVLFEGTPVAEGRTDGSGRVAVGWVVPDDASAGVHSIAFSGGGLYCNASSDGFRVTAGESVKPRESGTVGAAATAPPALMPWGSVSVDDGNGVAALAVVALVAAAGFGAVEGGRMLSHRLAITASHG